ncbi:uncharacterized protein BXZ73DRAFT_47438, partial [Epithele typhae]|uniref:uncharacterized protein n=1 Tax=Epithele typhae TaxID=378194 RepID=UPI0020087216
LTPNQGTEAGQAIEDAFILVSVLGHPSTDRQTLETALQAYERVRLLIANHVLRGSRESGDIRDDLAALGLQIGRHWDRLWKSTAQGERDRAIGMLQSTKAKL